MRTHNFLELAAAQSYIATSATRGRADKGQRAAPPTVRKGARLLGIYSAELGIPFLIAAFMVEQFAALFARLTRPAKAS